MNHVCCYVKKPQFLSAINYLCVPGQNPNKDWLTDLENDGDDLDLFDVDSELTQLGENPEHDLVDDGKKTGNKPGSPKRKLDPVRQGYVACQLKIPLKAFMAYYSLAQFSWFDNKKSEKTCDKIIFQICLIYEC